MRSDLTRNILKLGKTLGQINFENTKTSIFSNIFCTLNMNLRGSAVAKQCENQLFFWYRILWI